MTEENESVYSIMRETSDYSVRKSSWTAISGPMSQ